MKEISYPKIIIILRYYLHNESIRACKMNDKLCAESDLMLFNMNDIGHDNFNLLFIAFKCIPFYWKRSKALKFPKVRFSNIFEFFR